MKTRLSALMIAASFLLFAHPLYLEAAVYRVGSQEAIKTVSQVQQRLVAGDCVEVTSDMTDVIALTSHGTQSAPITIRGITTVAGARIMRPKIRAPKGDMTVLTCKGDWNVIEGLDISGQTSSEYKKAAVVQACGNLTIRNCCFNHNRRAFSAEENATGNLLVEFCEFDSNGYAERASVSMVSAQPGAKLIVQHCYFHNGTGGNLMRCCFPNNIVRYNWFESPYEHAVQVATIPLVPAGAPRSAELTHLSARTDIVGNVVLLGWGPGQPYCAFSLAGDSSEAPDSEGSFNILHNLIVTMRGGATPQVAVLAHGNIDRITMLNNIVMEWGMRGCQLYERGQVREGPGRQAFVGRRGSPDPRLEGSCNWISDFVSAVPQDFTKTLKGVNPGFSDMVDYDFQPAADSSLKGAGAWPLPDTGIESLVPEFEPQRGIPADLTPRRRAKASPPSVGPFESAETAPAFADDSADLVLSVQRSGGHFAWPLAFGRARRGSLQCLAQGKPQEALAWAKLQFLLSPMDDGTLRHAVDDVKQMLVAVDGNDSRAKVFEVYAYSGRAGHDGISGTSDDLANPLGSVSLDVCGRGSEYYTDFDNRIDLMAAMGADAPWNMRSYEQHWYITEKAMARLDGADFDAAFRLLAAPLLEALRKPAADNDEDKEMQRNAMVIDRVTAGMGVVARSRTSSLAYVASTLDSYRRCALYGPAGKDGRMGTADDVDLRESSLERGGAPPDQTSADSSAQFGAGQPWSQVDDASRLAAYKLDFLAEAAQGKTDSTADPFVYMAPTPREYLSAAKGRLGVVDFSKPRLESSGSVVKGESGAALASCDQRVVQAYKRVTLSGVPAGIAAKGRAYMAAYAITAHDAASYRAFLSLLSGAVNDDQLPLLMIEDMLSQLRDPLAAASAFDVLESVKPIAWEKQKGPLLARIKEREFETAIAGEKDACQPGGVTTALVYAWLTATCDDYLSRFPGDGMAPRMVLQKAYYRYKSGDFDGAKRECDAFVAAHAPSPLIPSARMLRSMALLESGNRQDAAQELLKLISDYPKSDLAPRASYVAGALLLELNRYGEGSACLRRILDYYSSSPYAAHARVLLDGIGDKGK